MIGKALRLKSVDHAMDIHGLIPDATKSYMNTLLFENISTSFIL
jgi:hypothetical protein